MLYGSFPCTLNDMKRIIPIILLFAALTGCMPSNDVGMDIYVFSIGKADCSLEAPPRNGRLFDADDALDACDNDPGVILEGARRMP